jgi:hypothetical protein
LRRCGTVPRSGRPRRATAHAFDLVDAVTKRTTRAPVPWVVCSHCGLVALKNDASRRAVRAACPGLLDDEAAP